MKLNLNTSNDVSGKMDARSWNTTLQLLEYLEQNWTSKEVASFINRTEKVIDYLSGNPRQYM